VPLLNVGVKTAHYFKSPQQDRAAIVTTLSCKQRHTKPGKTIPVLRLYNSQLEMIQRAILVKTALLFSC